MQKEKCLQRKEATDVTIGRQRLGEVTGVLMNPRGRDTWRPKETESVKRKRARREEHEKQLWSIPKNTSTPPLTV